jgi:ribosomal protein L16 Arg81 hydroxylase
VTQSLTPLRQVASIQSGSPGRNGRAGWAQAGLAALIGPVGVGDFAARYWEREPVIIRRDDPAYYAGLLTVDDVDHVLANSGLRESDLRVIVAGANVWVRRADDAKGHFAPGTLEDIYHAYRARGATINLTYLHERWPPLNRFCRVLAEELSAEIKSNVYLTPPGVQGLREHFDTHDVFVAQISGSKRWRFYPTRHPLPLQNQRYNWPPEGPGDPVAEFELTPGDLLYIPRGVVHDATSTEEASLHLAVGVIPVRWAELIREAVRKLTARELRYRASVPTAFTHDDWRKAATATAEDLLADLAAMLSPHHLLEELISARLGAARPELRGHLADLAGLESVSLDTPLLRRAGTEYLLTVGAEEAHLEFHGKAVTLPARLAPHLRFMASAGRFTGRTIPGDLAQAGRLVLIRTLLREGFLTIDTADGQDRADGRVANPA